MLERTKKFISRVLIWLTTVSLLWGAGVLWRSMGRPATAAFPSDELNAGLLHAHGSASSQMSVEQVSAILAKRLDPISPAEIPYLARHILALADRYHFDPSFILSMIQVESGFHCQAVSRSGAVGLMQLMPATAGVVLRDLGPDLSPVQWASLKHPVAPLWIVPPRILMDPFTNLTLGVAYLAYLRDRYRALNPFYLVAAYNLGPAKMDELLSKKTFKPGMTRAYFEAIRRAAFEYRSMAWGHSI